MEIVSLFKDIDKEAMRVIPMLSLFKPASDKEISHLKREVESQLDQGFPIELETWFHWHNGQQGNVPLFHNDNRYLLTIDEALRAWQFILDPSNEFLEPFERFWFPIMGNGSGDYLVYVMSGRDTGRLVGYWHDDIDREIEYESLLDWARYVLRHFQGIHSSITIKTNRIIEQESPENLTIAVSCKLAGKNFKLSQGIKKITNESLMDIVRNLSEGFPSSVFIRDLSTSINSIERSRDVRKVQNVAKIMQEYGISPILTIRKNSEDMKNSNSYDTITMDDLEILKAKCL